MGSRSPRSPRRSADDGQQMGGEFRSGPIAGTALVSGVTFAQKGLHFADVGGLAIFEGDIVLGATADIQGAADAGPDNPVLASVGITGQQFRWPNATIPFEIDPAMPNQQRVTDAIAHWQANTSIRFVQRTAANAAQFPNFAHFQSGDGCSSSVGMRGGRQDITLGDGCGTGNAIHEIGHTVGLWHEQSREDRDTFVRIVFANIDPALQFNFTQHISDGDDLGAYDYGSIMHYPPTAFSINGQPTIVALQPIPAGVVMGQRNGLSAGDIAGVQALYPAAPTIKEVPKDPIQDTVKELRKDPIQETLKELRKDPIQDTLKEAGKDPIRDTLKEIRKDPIQDTLKEAGKDPIQETVKELAKDPIQDTLKEAAGDPGGGGGTLAEAVTVPVQPPGPVLPSGASPFVMAAPSRVFGGAADPLADAGAQVQQLAEALVALEQQQAELMAAYDAAVQALAVLQQGSGG